MSQTAISVSGRGLGRLIWIVFVEIIEISSFEKTWLGLFDWLKC